MLFLRFWALRSVSQIELHAAGCEGLRWYSALGGGGGGGLVGHVLLFPESWWPLS